MQIGLTVFQCITDIQMLKKPHVLFWTVVARNQPLCRNINTIYEILQMHCVVELLIQKQELRFWFWLTINLYFLLFWLWQPVIVESSMLFLSPGQTVTNFPFPGSFQWIDPIRPPHLTPTNFLEAIQVMVSEWTMWMFQVEPQTFACG